VASSFLTVCAARALLQFARQLGEEAGPGRTPIRHRAAQGYLAAMAGVARDSVSCTFREWHRQKVVQGSSRTGYVVHKAKLEGAAGILARAEAEQRCRLCNVGASERLEHTMQLSGGAMKKLTGVDIFDLDNSGAPPTHSIDGMHAEPAVGNEP